MAILSILFLLVVVVMASGQVFSVQEVGDDLAGAPGAFFAAMPTLFIVFGGVVVAAGLLGIIAAILKGN